MEGLGAPDTYDLGGYSEASRLLEPAGTKAKFLLWKDSGGEVALPLLVRPIVGSTFSDATSPYGYGGPVLVGSPDVHRFCGDFERWAVDNSIVTTFLRFHPLRANAAWLSGRPELEFVGSTVAWDLSHNDLLASMHSHHRRAARKADRAGVLVRATRQPDNLDAFRKLYTETMDRQRARNYYYFADAYWQSLMSDRDIDLVLFEAVTSDNLLLAALLCFVSPAGALHYHLGASSVEGRRLGASNRCFLEAAIWAQSVGLGVFHLGGGHGDADDSPLLVFKRRFAPSADLLAFHVAKFTHSPKMYQELGACSESNFFPPWRDDSDAT